MLRNAFCVASFLVASAIKVRYNPDTHVAVKSSGCGSNSPYKSGRTTVAKASFGGVQYTYRVYVPFSYNKYVPMALITQHPGWGMNAASEQQGSGVCDHADSKGYICVVPQGANDNTHPGGPWYSWNAVGSTQSPGRDGPTCTPAASTSQNCYSSCGRCRDSPQCWWTTCDDEVTPTGTGYSHVNGYVPSLYDTLESQLCIDTTREYVAGESNGGMMTYQLSTDMSSRLAAAAPQFGSFHRGFLQGPTVAMPLIDIHGTHDTTVPANTSLSGDGFYYTPTADIFAVFGKANGCSGSSFHYPTPYDGQCALYCVSHGSCSGGDLIRCAWDGGHNWFGNSAALNGGLVTFFLLQWTETSHMGFGNKSEGSFLENIEIMEDVEQTVDAFDSLDVTLAPSSRGHYGNPSAGCGVDEDVLDLGLGRACAPRIASNKSQPPNPPVPSCAIGGAAPSSNGCPTDAPVPRRSKAFPVCIAKGKTSDPYVNAEFHCVLVCPCESVGPAFVGNHDTCGAASDAHCPAGATCQRGELRNRGQGVCTYPAPLATIV